MHQETTAVTDLGAYREAVHLTQEHPELDFVHAYRRLEALWTLLTPKERARRARQLSTPKSTRIPPVERGPAGKILRPEFANAKG